MTTTQIPTTTSRTRTVVLASAALLAGVGITAGVVLGLGAASPGPTAAPTSSAVVSGGTEHSRPAHHVTPAAPSAAIETLQRELGQLDYYDGPVTGIVNSQTTQAITYLQRDAHLPRTGTMNTATRAALANFLAHGNNQMGS